MYYPLGCVTLFLISATVLKRSNFLTFMICSANFGTKMNYDIPSRLYKRISGLYPAYRLVAIIFVIESLAIDVTILSSSE